MKTIIAVSLLLSTSPSFADFTKLAQEALPKTVEVHVDGTVKGSGVYIDSSGTVLTSAHLFKYRIQETPFGVRLEVPEQIVIVWEYPGYIAHKGYLAQVQPATDLALVELFVPHETPYMVVAKSAEIGDEVMAVGSPFAFGWSVTAGIISRLHGTVNGRPVTQSDVSINPGNSGGPLVDKHGKLVGIASSLYTVGGMYNGITFFINLEAIENFLTVRKSK